MAAIPELSQSEFELIQNGRYDPDLITDYFFRKPGSSRGWLFDANFAPEYKWQKQFCKARQSDITIIGGFGSGKTVGVGMAAVAWSMMVNRFKFLNVAPLAWQSALMYKNILDESKDTRFGELILKAPSRPYPQILLRYKYNRTTYESSFEFMSADKDGKNILSWEGDWINIDEAGLLDDLQDLIQNLGSRLRGSVQGRPRLGRLSMTSNSWDNFDLWYYFDMAAADPENFLSKIIPSQANKNVTEKQLARMISRIPKSERSRLIDGARPEGRGAFYSKEAVGQCEVLGELEIVEQQVEDGVPFTHVDKVTGPGVVTFEKRPWNDRSYIVLGDPGVDNPPKRNSPVLMVWDVSEFPARPASLAAFWWGFGNGMIQPFVNKLLDYTQIYKAVYAAVDSTASQAHMNYLINTYVFKERFEEGIETKAGILRGIQGLDFSSHKKMQYLLSLRLLLEANKMIWPSGIVGIRSQLINYDPAKDGSGSNAKIAQDIVATMAMTAHVLRSLYEVDLEETYREAEKNMGSFEDRRSTNRTKRSAYAREIYESREAL